MTIIGEQGKVAEHLKRLFGTLVAEVTIAPDIPEAGQNILDITNLPAANSVAKAISRNHELFKRARYYAKNARGKGIYAIVSGSEFEKGYDRFTAGAFGLIKTAAFEWPETYLKTIGIARKKLTPEEQAELIFREITGGGSDTEVFYDSHKKRYTLALHEVTPKALQNTIEDGQVVVVSGGGSGVTADCILRLAEEFSLKFAILGRTRLAEEPDHVRGVVHDKELKAAWVHHYQALGKTIDLQEINREVRSIQASRRIRSTLKKLNDLGAEARYYSTDVTHEKAIAETFRSIKNEWGDISVLIHGAGVLADKLIKDKTDEQFHHVFHTKVRGFMNLLKATAREKLTHICCFSSVAGRFGNIGQSDYAMANEILNKICRYEQLRREDQCSVRSINWGPWDGGMVSPEIKAYLQSRGASLIPVKEGADLFVKVLNEARGTVEVVVGTGIENWKNPVLADNTYALWVNSRTEPLIKDHIIKGTAIVPMALISERIRNLIRGNLGFANPVIRDLKVLKGLKIPDYEKEGAWIEVKLSNPEDHTVEAGVYDVSKNKCYQLTVIDEHPPTPPMLGLPENAQEWKVNPDEIYINKLFHGKGLHMIRAINAFSGEGAECRFNPIPDDPDHQVKIIDGGLQLALLWVDYRYRHTASLPMSYRSLTWYEPPQPRQTIACRLKVNESSELATSFEVQYIDPKEEKVLAAIEGLQLVVYQLA